MKGGKVKKKENNDPDPPSKRKDIVIQGEEYLFRMQHKTGLSRGR